MLDQFREKANQLKGKIPQIILAEEAYQNSVFTGNNNEELMNERENALNDCTKTIIEMYEADKGDFQMYLKNTLFLDIEIEVDRIYDKLRILNKPSFIQGLITELIVRIMDQLTSSNENKESDLKDERSQTGDEIKDIV